MNCGRLVGSGDGKGILQKIGYLKHPVKKRFASLLFATTAVCVLMFCVMLKKRNKNVQITPCNSDVGFKLFERKKQVSD